MFRSGAATFDITPINYRDTYLAGFAPGRLAKGVLDPLYARCVYLKSGQTDLAIVALDLIGLHHSFAKKIRKAVSVIPAKRIFLCCTHTHSGPDTLGLWGPAIGDIPYSSGVNKNYMKLIEQAVVHVVKKARKRAVPAVIAFGGDKDQKDDITWNIRQPGFMDHEMSIMRIDKKDGSGTIATLINYGSHPESLGEENKRISPDFPVSLHRTVERGLGGVSIFINGALGAMVTPGIEQEAPLFERESFYAGYGNKLGKIALKTARNIKFEPDPELTVASKEISMPVNNKMLIFAAGLGVLGRNLSPNGITTEVGHIQIGPATIMAAPGEISPAVGIQIKKNMVGDFKFLFSLCNDEIGYVLDKHVFYDPRFSYEKSMSIGAGTAEKIKDTYTEISR